ncbi:hypothetical protein Pla163_34300 [Planctomycetes bacterium Pla163]|uniref:Uncharacterized protein n=1 Tax=Rohdeia mirabilis TaxID=2528008 RepID=A0A518D489_9BACT|nr:hypothetical protein Pla163_34300 [Planctomycetes bacterium Pla163]
MPCADEVWRLQNLDEPDCLHFQSFCDSDGRLNHRDASATRQGTYCVTPSGILLGSANHRDPRRIAELLRTSLAKWNELDPAERLLETDPRETARSIRRAELNYPEDGLVLRVDSRDLPRTWEGAEQPDPDDWRTHAWNFDYAWFRAAEVERLVPAELAIGASWDLPADLVQRLCRLHLTDNVRGQTDHYARDEVRTARITATVTQIEDGVAHLGLEGALHLEIADGSRGLRGTMLGTARLALDAPRTFEAFEAVVVADRWGATRFNQRHDDRDHAPVGFAIHLAGDGPTERIAPTAFWEYGWR